MKKENRALTAIHRNYISVPYRILMKDKISKADRILDYGCGYGKDLELFNINGYNITGYDLFIEPYNDISVLKRQFDYIICNYVLNVIEDPQERKILVSELLGLVPILYIALRADIKAIKDNWQPYNDGFITKAGTFQKMYSKQEALNEFMLAGTKIEIISSNSHMILLAISKDL